MNHARRSLVWIVLLGLVALPAYGQQPAPPRDERELTARQLFAVGKYAESLDIYGRLYAETAHPTHLRNIGRCYQNIGDPDRAISSFSEYLRQARDLPADQRALIDGYIREMEELKRKRAAASASQPTAPVPAAPPPASPPASQPAVETLTTPANAPDPAPERTPRRTVAYVVGGASLAALAVGGFFGVRAILKRRESDPNCPMDRCNDVGWAPYQEAKTAARVSDVMIGAGLIGAGVAIYLFVTSRAPVQSTAASAARGLRVEPVAGTNHAGLLVGATW